MLRKKEQKKLHYTERSNKNGCKKKRHLYQISKFSVLQIAAIKKANDSRTRRDYFWYLFANFQHNT